MAYFYLGVPAASSAGAGDVVDGVYLRMGTYVYTEDTSTTPSTVTASEEGRAPASYTDAEDMADSEGVFISTSGTYIVQSGGKGYLEFENGVTQTVDTDSGDVTTEVESGDLTIETTDGGNISIEGDSSFYIRGEKGSNEKDVLIDAENGITKMTADAIHENTWGIYDSRTWNYSKKTYEQTAVSLAVSLVASFYCAASFSFKTSSISVKITSASAKLIKISTGLLSMGFVFNGQAYQATDTKLAFFYMKSLACQLESNACVKDGVVDNESISFIVEAHINAFLANQSPIKSTFGLRSEIPGMVPA